ncbi:response regulator transcription factor [Roseateles sp. L2-2]|uniref:response regulator transcription factor n=1 Tax=Roseateles sp. L2-2 TaxID=3422597 RepID=UPI003D363496
MNASLDLDLLVLHHDPIVDAGIRALLSGLPCLRRDPRRSAADLGFGARLVVADYRQGMAWIHRAKEQFAQPGARLLLLLSAEGEREIRVALRAGVGGLLAPGCGVAELREAAAAVAQGSRHLSPSVAHQLADAMTRTPLTERETAVLHLIAAGMSNKGIARELAISVTTVKTHVRAILDKLRATSRTQAVSRAGEQRLIPPVHEGRHPDAAPSYARTPGEALQ